MHKSFYKIKVAFLCNKSFSNSIEELKPFLGFDLNEIHPQKEPNSINSENQVLIADSSCAEKVSFEKINIPKVLILGQNEKNTFKDKFDATMKLPLNIIQFNRAVIDLSQKHKFDQNSLVQVKDYILDKNTRFLKRKENSVKITEKEMHFIEELNNSSEPLTKDYILKNIWGYSSDADTHTVETHIYRLRQKIKNQFNDNNFIKHTKEGYSF
tara:strand:+ start:1439 stop:2074 length:636 start_codon:yes stop_codon:yes gene_type:complete